VRPRFTASVREQPRGGRQSAGRARRAAIIAGEVVPVDELPAGVSAGLRAADMFDSQAEASRYLELQRLEQLGLIAALTRQPRFELVVNGVRIGVYTADFQYRPRDAEADVVEDVKGQHRVSEGFSLRVRLLWALHRIKVERVHMRIPPKQRRPRRRGR
jgi:hypothetical protein